MPIADDIFSAFRQALDKQDINDVRRFIDDNQDLNYNAIAPNGASALWWALTPPRGKTISVELLRTLLNYLKNNGEPVVNPVQEFYGIRPSAYADHNTESGEIRQLLNNAENAYVAPQRNQPQNLAGIAADAQNVHDSGVTKLSRANLYRLYQRYVSDEAPLDENCIVTCPVF